MEDVKLVGKFGKSESPEAKKHGTSAISPLKEMLGRVIYQKQG
jgi:hypothetical protein